MNPCGVIVTYISRKDWQGQKFWIKLRTMLFNVCLFLYQLTFMIVGTAYGKFKWPKAPLWIRIASTVGMGTASAGIVTATIDRIWHLIPINIISFVILVAIFRGIDWCCVWRAARVSHVRLVLDRAPDEEAMVDIEWTNRSKVIIKTTVKVWNTANFGHPKMEIQPWREDWNKGNRRYFDPRFEPSPEFIAAMIEYAEKQVGKRYDEYQLISNALHLIAWIIWPWWWGQELRIIKALNRPGGLEHCISGVTACLRWGEFNKLSWPEIKIVAMNIDKWKRTSKFFPGYSTATTSPCLIELSKNWEEK